MRRMLPLFLLGCGTYTEKDYVNDWLGLWCDEFAQDCPETATYTTGEEDACIAGVPAADNCDDIVACYLPSECVFDPKAAKECVNAQAALAGNGICADLAPECDDPCLPDFG